MSRTVVRRLAALLGLLALFLLAIAVTGLAYQPNTKIATGYLGHHVSVRGIPIRVLQQGAGRDVLLIHGSPGSLEDFRPVMEVLAREFRVTAFDRPGHGFSGDTGSYSYRHNAEMTLALIDALGLKHVVVVGHSYGGATALAMALHTPAKVDRYVVLDSAVYQPSRPATALYRMLNLPILGLGFATVLPSSVAAKKIREGLLSQFRVRPPSEPFIAMRTKLWSTPKVAHAVAKEVMGTAAELEAQSPRYARITRPLEIVAQAEDPFRRRTATRLHREVSGSRLTLLPGTGHYLQFERTREVVEIIARSAVTR